MNSAESPRPVVVGIDGSDAAIEAARSAAKEAVHQDARWRSFAAPTGRRRQSVSSQWSSQTNPATTRSCGGRWRRLAHGDCSVLVVRAPRR